MSAEYENRGETPMHLRTIGITPPHKEAWSPGVQRPSMEQLRVRYRSVDCPYCGARVCSPCLATDMSTGTRHEAMYEHESRMAITRDQPSLYPKAEEPE